MFDCMLLAEAKLRYRSLRLYVSKKGWDNYLDL